MNLFIILLLKIIFHFAFRFFLVEIGRVRKEMEVDIAKLQRDIQLLNQSMIQQEREAQVALKTEQQAHEEDIEKGAREKVNYPSICWIPIMSKIRHSKIPSLQTM